MRTTQPTLKEFKQAIRDAGEVALKWPLDKGHGSYERCEVYYRTPCGIESEPEFQELSTPFHWPTIDEKILDYFNEKGISSEEEVKKEALRLIEKRNFRMTTLSDKEIIDGIVRVVCHNGTF